MESLLLMGILTVLIFLSSASLWLCLKALLRYRATLAKNRPSSGDNQILRSTQERDESGILLIVGSALSLLFIAGLFAPGFYSVKNACEDIFDLSVDWISCISLYLFLVSLASASIITFAFLEIASSRRSLYPALSLLVVFGFAFFCLFRW